MTTTTIELLRHGLPEGGDCMRGSTDVALSPIGWQQMDRALVEQAEFDHIISSPLIRCADFAKKFGQQISKQVKLVENWREIDFGDWDGIAYSQLWQQQKQPLSQYWSDPWRHTPPRGESLAAFDTRINQAWQQLLDDYEGKHLLVVTHGGVMRQIIHQLLKLPQDNTHLSRIDLPYASRIKITVYLDQNHQQWPRLHWPV